MLVVKDWLQEFLPRRLSLQQLTTAMEAAGIEVEGIREGGQVIDVSTAANRSDLNSLLGVAREVAAHTNSQLSFEATEPAVKSSKPSSFTINAKKAVGRYMLAELKLTKRAGASPQWLKQRLHLSGIRPINIVVDITNYCTLAYGQSMHAFDRAKVNGKFVIRFAKPGEQLTTLDGQSRNLTSEDLIIADDSGVIDLAGIMGGLSTEISRRSSTIWLTVPNFDGTTVRKTALRLGLRTEASARFERGLPVQLVPLALNQVLQLLDELVGIELDRVEDEIIARPTTVKVTISPQRLSQLAGIPISKPAITTSLGKLNFAARPAAGKVAVTVPYWRPDVASEADLFEEVIKLIGLDKLPATIPQYRVQEARYDSYWPKIWRLRDLMAGLGGFEVTTYPFVSTKQLDQLGFDIDDHLKLQNPRSSEQSHLRLTLLGGLLTALENNRLYSEQFSLFEIGRIFRPHAKRPLPHEQLQLAVIVKTDRQAYGRVKNFLDQLGQLLQPELDLRAGGQAGALHPGRQATVHLGNTRVGLIGELHPAILRQLKLKDAAYLELELEQLLAAWKTPRYRPVSRFQPVSRDLTIVVDQSVSWAQIAKLVSQPTAQVAFIGDYYGKGLPADKKTVTFSLTMEADHTLAEAEISQRLSRLADLLKKNLGAQLKD